MYLRIILIKVTCGFRQLRDDLMTMLIAGHETTAAVLTWAVFFLAQVFISSLNVAALLGFRIKLYRTGVNLPSCRTRPR